MRSNSRPVLFPSVGLVNDGERRRGLHGCLVVEGATGRGGLPVMGSRGLTAFRLRAAWGNPERKRNHIWIRPAAGYLVAP